MSKNKGIAVLFIAALAVLFAFVAMACGSAEDRAEATAEGAGNTGRIEQTGENKVLYAPPVETFSTTAAPVHEEKSEYEIMIDAIIDSPEMFAFPSPVKNWNDLDLTGFTGYGIPRDYERNGGAFPLCLQAYTYAKCREYGVDFALILAMIETESSYKSAAISYDGKCKGFMQINEYYHADRMARVGAHDLYNPYDNIATGVDFVAELLGKYDGNVLKVLAAYNMGATGAYRNLWSKGVYEYSYTDKVTQRAERITREIAGGKTT